ncbi:hypothetical protein TRFO_31932 [Tritrichomonas foetus]|uniref:Uncharacterized protein n=1 Tax=Tritrichomonas foetus TaxID=1144522 RepID=A0A1J4JQE7_9EUKA|nr:hypothetical protein TRFO_31932 [Tritrichomonas foetus]|eukprot:OHT01267.1 hypothetical protein TRFO_31932 [Tritrichomonas foetus]
MTNLNAYFKNEISSLKRFVESNKEKANLPIYRLYKHLSYHRRASIHSFESDTINRGENFKYSPPILSRVDLDELYFYLLTIPDILESSYNIADERTKIGYKLVAQIAAHDFPYFVNKLAPPLFETENEKLHNLTAALSRIILDPTTGFLANAPHNPKNDVWHDKDHNFDFFNVESSDLKTPFGKALWDYREKLNHLLFSYFTDKTNTRSTEFDYITTFTPSFLNFIQSTIVPPNFPYQKLSCGFSQRAQILLAFSRIQDLEYFSKNKSYRVEKSYAACQKWIDILNDDETESMTLTQVSSLEFHKPVNIQNSVKYRLLKLIVFLNPTGLSSQKNIDQYIVSGILGSDKVMTGFMIFIFQAIVFIYPKLSFLIMDAIFSKIDTYIVQNAAQHYTIIHSLTRYVDILSCLPERYLDTEQITKANAFAICGLASANPYVRIASNKLMSVLSSYETDDKNICAYSFLNRNKEHFEKILIEFYAKDPRVQFKDMSHHALLPMAFDDAMKSISSTLWCRFIRLISRRGNEEWPDSLKTYVVKYGYQLITFHVEKNLHSLDIGCIGTMFTLVGGLENKCCNELNEKLIQSLVILVFNYYDAYYTNIIVMLNVVRPRFYKLIIRSMIKIIDETNSRHNALSLVIRVIAQNKEFEKYMRDPELANLFIDALDKLFYSLNIDYHVEFDHSFITKYSVDLLHAATSLHTMLFNKYKKKDITPFPCWPCLLTNESRPECDRIQGRIKHAIYLAKVDVFEENKIFHYWAMKCLSSLCMIITIKDTKMLFNDTFNEILVEFASEEHNIIAYILSNHFLLLFSRYIELALMPDGMPFFNAICRFFRTKHPKKFASSVIKEVLYHQWTASVNISQDSQFTEMLQVIYENSGSLIFMCFFYLNTTSTADLHLSYLQQLLHY